MSVVVRHEYFAVRKVHGGEHVISPGSAKGLLPLFTDAAVVLRKAQSHEQRPEWRTALDEVFHLLHVRTSPGGALKQARTYLQMRPALTHKLFGDLANGWTSFGGGK